MLFNITSGWNINHELSNSKEDNLALLIYDVFGNDFSDFNSVNFFKVVDDFQASLEMKSQNR